jgi:hypothetical protein
MYAPCVRQQSRNKSKLTGFINQSDPDVAQLGRNSHLFAIADVIVFPSSRLIPLLGVIPLRGGGL